jgi:hypothetical protein
MTPALRRSDGIGIDGAARPLFTGGSALNLSGFVMRPSSL